MIIPKPKSFSQSGEIEIDVCVKADECLYPALKGFIRVAKRVYGLNFVYGDNGIEVKYDANLKGEEYKISGKYVYASTLLGAKNGLATILQLLKVNELKFILKNCEISDKPDKEFRGLMICRESVQMVLNYIDICYVNKMNYIHIHLNDNTYCALPLECLPNAITKDNCYTKEEIEYIVEYAHDAGVEIIPEFEFVGHSKEIIKLCPEIFANDYSYVAPDGTDVNSLINQVVNEIAYQQKRREVVDDVMCIGNPEIFKVIKNILTEIASIFKYSRYIHVGCDEADFKKWDFCTRCRKYMEDNGIESSAKLYAHFVAKVVDMCFECGKTPVVWEGFEKEYNDMINKNTLIMCWDNSFQNAHEFEESGFKLVNASWKPLYYCPNSILPEGHESRTWTLAGENFEINTWQHHGSFSDAHFGLTAKNKEDVIGGLMCIWGTSIPYLHDRVMLNMPTLADRSWNETGYYTKEELESVNKRILEIEKMFN